MFLCSLNIIGHVQVIFHPRSEFLHTVAGSPVLEDMHIVLVYSTSALSSLLYKSAETLAPVLRFCAYEKNSTPLLCFCAYIGLRTLARLGASALVCRKTSRRTPMTCLPWRIRTRFWVPTKLFRQLKKTSISGNFLILS